MRAGQQSLKALAAALKRNENKFEKYNTNTMIFFKFLFYFTILPHLFLL